MRTGKRPSSDGFFVLNKSAIFASTKTETENVDY